MGPAHTPGVCRHAAFDLNGNDRVRTDFSAALRLANERAQKTGRRQTVRRHVGYIFRNGIWFVQEAGRPPVEVTS